MNNLLRDSCSALLSEALRSSTYGTVTGVHRASWFSSGPQWMDVVVPHHVEGFKTMTEPDHDATLVAYGIHPRDWVAAGLVRRRFHEPKFDGNYVYRGGVFLSHPIYLGMAFTKMLGDPEGGRWFLEDHAKLPQTHSAGLTSAFWKPSWIPPFGLADLGLTQPLAPGPNDNVSMMALFDKKEISSLLLNRGTGVNVEDIAQVAVVLNAPLHLADAASSALGRWWTSSSRLPYAFMAQMLRMVPVFRAEQLLNDVKGVRQGLGIARMDTPRELMIRGLRAVSGMAEDGIYTFSALYGRSPTISELQALGGSGLINILYYMPWDFLELLVEGDASALRAMTLPHLGALDGLKRHCLQNHNKRAKLLHYAGREAGIPSRVTDKTTSADWLRVYAGLTKQYRRAAELRAALSAVEPDPVIRLVAVMPRFGVATKESVERVMRHHPAYQRISELTANIVEPTWSPDHLVNL